MKYIQFDPKSLTVLVAEGEQRTGTNIPVARADIRENPWKARIRVSSAVYHVLNRAVEAEDRRKGEEVAYFLVPPDPWLVAIGMIMWEGVVGGFAWDTVKALVHKALSVMRKHGVAPESENHVITQKEATELGFAWTSYLNGKKQYHMFVGLRRIYLKTTRANPKTKRKISRNRKGKSIK